MSLVMTATAHYGNSCTTSSPHRRRWMRMTMRRPCTRSGSEERRGEAAGQSIQRGGRADGIAAPSVAASVTVTAATLDASDANASAPEAVGDMIVAIRNW